MTKAYFIGGPKDGRVEELPSAPAYLNIAIPPKIDWVTLTESPQLLNPHNPSLYEEVYVYKRYTFRWHYMYYIVYSTDKDIHEFNPHEFGNKFGLAEDDSAYAIECFYDGPTHTYLVVFYCRIISRHEIHRFEAKITAESIIGDPNYALAKAAAILFNEMRTKLNIAPESARHFLQQELRFKLQMAAPIIATPLAPPRSGYRELASVEFEGVEGLDPSLWGDGDTGLA